MMCARVCVIHWHCSAQLSMFNMEKRYRNKIIIIIIRDDIVGQQGAVWARIAKDRERWRTLAGGYFMQWEETA